MSYNPEQEKIDEAVREAIAAPRRQAEIEKRIALVTSLEPLAEAEIGTVLTFAKKQDKTDKAPFTYAAVKVESDTWAVTGDGRYSNGSRYSLQSLLDWMTTGPHLAENVLKADGFSAVATA